MSDLENQLINARLRLWLRRLMWIFALSMLSIAVCAYLGIHTGWIGFITSLVCAEFSRRVMGEQRPGGPLSWLEILRYGFGMDDEPGKTDNPKQKDDH